MLEHISPRVFFRQDAHKVPIPLWLSVFLQLCISGESLYCPISHNEQLQSCVCGQVIPGCAQGTARHCVTLCGSPAPWSLYPDMQLQSFLGVSASLGVCRPAVLQL